MHYTNLAWKRLAHEQQCPGCLDLWVGSGRLEFELQLQIPFEQTPVQSFFLVAAPMRADDKLQKFTRAKSSLGSGPDAHPLERWRRAVLQRGQERATSVHLALMGSLWELEEPPMSAPLYSSHLLRRKKGAPPAPPETCVAF